METRLQGPLGRIAAKHVRDPLKTQYRVNPATEIAESRDSVFVILTVAFSEVIDVEIADEILKVWVCIIPPHLTLH
jgi:hypothetical protein